MQITARTVILYPIRGMAPNREHGSFHESGATVGQPVVTILQDFRNLLLSLHPSGFQETSLVITSFTALLTPLSLLENHLKLSATSWDKIERLCLRPCQSRDQ